MAQLFYLEFTTDDHMQAFINAGALADLEPADRWLTCEPIEMLIEQIEGLRISEKALETTVERLKHELKAQAESMTAQGKCLVEMGQQLETTEAVRDQYQRALESRDRSMRQMDELMRDQDKFIERIQRQRDRLVSSVAALTEIIDPL